jgi:hypothetical protein
MLISKYRIVFTAILLASFLEGCSLFKPYVDTNPGSDKLFEDSKNFPLLQKSVQKVEDIRKKEVICRRNEATIMRGVLNLATYGAAATAGGAALYGASTDLILGLGIGATSTYLFENLFYSDTKTHLYNEANIALGCVVETGSFIVNTDKSINVNPHNHNDGAQFITDRISCENEDWIKARNDWDNAVIDWNQANQKLDNFKSMDAIASQKIEEALNKIVISLNTQIESSNPSIGTILNAAKSIAPLAATSFSQNASSSGQLSFLAKQAAAEESPIKICTSDEISVLKKLTNALINDTKSINQTIDQAVNKLSEIGNNCSLDKVEITTLTANPSSLQITAKSVNHVVLSGGMEPINRVPARWKDKDPGEDLTIIASGPRDLIIIGAETINNPGQYTLLVSDSRAAPQTVEINITIKQ